jgi:hypothetical protein
MIAVRAGVATPSRERYETGWSRYLGRLQRRRVPARRICFTNAAEPRRRRSS